MSEITLIPQIGIEDLTQSLVCMMNFSTQTTLFGLAGILSGILMIGLGIWLYNDQQERERYTCSFVRLLVVAAVWNIFAGLEFVLPGTNLKIASILIHSSGALMFPYVWIAFVEEYTNSDNQVFQSLVQASFIISVVFVGITLTDPIFHLYFSDFSPKIVEGTKVIARSRGIFWWPGYIYEYSITLIALGKFIWFSFSTGSMHTRKLKLFILSGFIPILFELSSTLEVGIFHPHVNATPFGFVIWTATLVYIIYGHKLFSITPIGRQQIVERLQDPVIIVDKSGVIIDFNPAADVILEDDPGGKPLQTVAPDNLSDIAGEVAVNGGLQSDENSIDTEFARRVNNVTIDTNGSTYTFNVLVSAIYNKYDEFRGRAIVLRDITDLQAKQQALQDQNERLEEFTDVVSHDLRSPLNSLDGFVELLQREYDDPRIDGIENATDRMVELVDGLLTLSRQGKVVEDPSNVDLAIRSKRAWETVPGEDVSIAIDSSVGTVQGDGNRLQQALENLFRNAIHHGGNVSEIRIGLLQEGQGFFVEDDGTGIPESAVDQIFESGYSTEDSGTGLGLAIVRRVIEAHGWDISVTEGQDGGARFEITGLDASTE